MHMSLASARPMGRAREELVATLVVRAVWEALTCVLVERVISWEGALLRILDGEALMACRVLRNHAVRCLVLRARSECGGSSWQSSRMLLVLRAPPSSRRSRPRSVSRALDQGG